MRFVGGVPASPFAGIANLPGIRRGPINNWTEALGNGAVIALDPKTGEQRWRFPTTDVSSSGILTTATDLLFTGSREGYFYALDARTGDAALAHEPRRPGRERPDVVCRRRRAVRRRCVRQRVIRLRLAEVARAARWRREPRARGDTRYCVD